MPTMLGAIGAEVPLQCDGASLAPFVEGAGGSVRWRSEAHWEFDFRDPRDDSAERELGLTMHQCTMNIVRGERFKYVHFTNLPPLFFDLEKDPGEFVNLAGDASYAPIVLEYAQKLLSWRMNHDEQTLTHIMLSEDGPITRRAARY
jgi:arylsulfatase A-like enzyme